MLALILVVGLGLCAIFVPSGPPDPIYDGKPLSYWLRQPPKFKPYHEWIMLGPALDNVDTNAIPMLVYELDRVHNPFRRAYSATWNKSHHWLQVTLPKPTDNVEVRRTAMQLLSSLLPVTSTQPLTAMQPLILSPQLDSPLLGPALVRSLEQDHDARVRCDAAMLLGRLGKFDPSVGRALRHGLHDPDYNVRVFSTNSFRQLNPIALPNAATK